MLRNDVQLISVDDHVIEPPNVWTDRLPAKWQELGPHIVEVEGHKLDWEYEGRRFPLAMQGSRSTRRFRDEEPPKNQAKGKVVSGEPAGLLAQAMADQGSEIVARHYDDMIPGCYDPLARVQDMDADGIHAGIEFATFPRYCGQTFWEAKDRELGLLCVQAYNDWMIDDWCAAAPGRFIPMVIMPLWDPELAAKEIERTAAKGAKAVSFSENPVPLGLPSYWTKHWDPFLSAVEDADMAMCVHIGSSSKMTIPAPEASPTVPIALCGLNSMSAMADMVFSGVLVRHPNLRIALSEGGSGWVPYLVERMDYTWERTRLQVDRSIAPSELVKRHFWTCIISDKAAIDQRYQIGIDKIMWECDYPHNDSNWPNSRKLIEEELAQVPDDEAAMIAETNARQLFRFPRTN